MIFNKYILGQDDKDELIEENFDDLSNNNLYFCNHCQLQMKPGSKFGNLLTHFYNVHTKSCPECDGIFESNDALTRHIKMLHK